MLIKIKCGTQLMEEFKSCWNGFCGYNGDELIPENIESLNKTVKLLQCNKSFPNANNIYNNIPCNNDGDDKILIVRKTLDMYSAALYYCAFLHKIDLHPLLIVNHDSVLAGVWITEDCFLDTNDISKEYIEDQLYENGGSLFIIDAWKAFNGQDNALILNWEQYEEYYSDDVLIIDFDKENEDMDYIILADIEDSTKERIQYQQVNGKRDYNRFHFFDLSDYDSAVSDTVTDGAVLLVDSIPKENQCVIAADSAVMMIAENKKVLIVASEEGRDKIKEIFTDNSLENLLFVSGSDDDFPQLDNDEEIDISITDSYKKSIDFQEKMDEIIDELDITIRDLFILYCEKEDKSLDKYLYDEHGKPFDRNIICDSSIIKRINEAVKFYDKHYVNNSLNINMNKMDSNTFARFKNIILYIDETEKIYQDNLLKLIDKSQLDKTKNIHRSDINKVLKIIDYGKKLKNIDSQQAAVQSTGTEYGMYCIYLDYIRTVLNYFDLAKFESNFASDYDNITSKLIMLNSGNKRDRERIITLITNSVVDLNTQNDLVSVVRSLLETRLSLGKQYNICEKIYDCFGNNVNDRTFNTQLEIITEFSDMNDAEKAFLRECSSGSDSEAAKEWFNLSSGYNNAYNGKRKAIENLNSFFLNSESIEKSLIDKWLEFVKSGEYDKFEENIRVLSSIVNNLDDFLKDPDIIDKIEAFEVMHNALLVSDKVNIKPDLYNIRNNRYKSLSKKIRENIIEKLIEKQKKLYLTTFTDAKTLMDRIDTSGFDMLMICESENCDYEYLNGLLIRCRERICFSENSEDASFKSVLKNIGSLNKVLIYDNKTKTGDYDNNEPE